MKNIKELMLNVQDYQLKYGRKPNKVYLNNETWVALRKDIYELNGLKYTEELADRLHKDTMLVGGVEVVRDMTTTIDYNCEG